MYSQIETFAKIQDVPKLKTFLCGDTSDEKWLHQCLLAISPSRDNLVVANYNKLALLSSKWCPQKCETKIEFHITWQGIPESSKDKEVITAVFCLPVTKVQSKVTTHYNPEWTCFIIGFSSGYVRFYTETGCLLVTQLFDNNAVTDIKYHSPFDSSVHSGSNEEIYIAYGNVICTIIGIALLNTLRACRNQLAKVRAKCSEMVSVPPLTYRKWKLVDHNNIHDCVIAGPVPTNSFNHFMTASLCGGFNAEYRNSAPQGTLMIAVGTDPFVGFHYALESSAVPVIADVAKAMASKLKSALGQTMSGWLFGSQGSSVIAERESESIVLEQPEATSFRFGFYDSGRVGNSIVMSPLGNVCAVTDGLGRVSIIDITSGTVIRMLKGYRDAQCGWLVVDSSGVQDEVRKTVFLVIYIPKKGTVEVWPLHSGGRITVFDLQEYGRLLYTNSSGIFSTDARKIDRSTSVCILLEPSGDLREIIVPFHCCFRNEDSEKARDTHIYKVTNRHLSEDNLTTDKVFDLVVNLAVNLKTVDMKKLAIQTLSENKYVTSDVFLKFLQTLEENLNTEEKTSFLPYVDKMKRLTTFFHFVNDTYQLPPDYSTVVEDTSEYLVKEVCDVLGMVEEDLDKLITLIPTTRAKSKHVSFSTNVDSLNLATFLKAFDIDDGLSTCLKSDVSELSLSDISDLVCSGIMCSKCDLELWIKICQYSEINPTDILKMVFSYWLSKQMGITINREMLNLYKIILAVCDLIKDVDIKWKKIRHLLANSKSPLSAITAAIVCRAVSAYRHSVKCKAEVEFESNEDGEKELCWSSDWETISEDECDWNMLVSQLEDIAFLDSVLKYQPKSPPAKMFCVQYNLPDVTLSSIIKSGKGSISELVAKWIVSMGLNPEYLLYYENVPTKKPNTCCNSSSSEVQEGTIISTEKCYEAKPVTTVEKEVLVSLGKLKLIFPHSLSAQNILLNVTWEYALAWKTSVGQLKTLEASVVTLKLIPSARIRHGCCCLMWNAHLSAVCEATSRLINKVGRLPKDRLCKQNIGISEESLTEFVKLWVDFIDVFIECIMELNTNFEAVSLQYEVLWENNEQTKVTAPALCQLVVEQKICNRHILSLQSQCSRALLLLTTFSIKMPKPITNLFDSSSEQLLFSSIQSPKEFRIYTPDEKLIESRITFLKRAMCAVINDVLKASVEPNKQTTECMELIKPAMNWLSTITTMASEWSVPVDNLRRFQINELYIQGYDRLAEEIIPSVSDKETLGYELLIVLGCRIKQLLKTTPNSFSDFSPNVTSWICSLEENEKVTTVEVKYLLQLALTTNQLIAENSKDRYLINQILDSLEVINERNDNS